MKQEEEETMQQVAEVRAADNPEHPVLKNLQEALLRKPDLTQTQALNYGVASKTLRTWIKHGWLKFRPPKKPVPITVSAKRNVAPSKRASAVL